MVRFQAIHGPCVVAGYANERPLFQGQEKQKKNYNGVVSQYHTTGNNTSPVRRDHTAARLSCLGSLQDGQPFFSFTAFPKPTLEVQEHLYLVSGRHQVAALVERLEFERSPDSEVSVDQSLCGSGEGHRHSPDSCGDDSSYDGFAYGGQCNSITDHILGRRNSRKQRHTCLLYTSPSPRD